MNAPESLEERLERLLADDLHQENPLLDELRFFAEHAIKSERTLEKLIRISDHMQGELTAQRRELQGLNLQKNRLFSIVAHDLRGSIGTFINSAQLLHEDYDTLKAEEHRTLARLLHESGERLLWLLENLLEWSRLQIGGIRYNPSVNSLAARFHYCAQQLSPLAHAKGVKLNFTATTLRVLADVHMLDTVLRNLVSNALKFTPGGGEVMVFARAAGEWIEVTVEDTGIGMEKEILDTLFSGEVVPESRLGTANEKGSGLGLLLCHDLVERHGGTIEARSTLGVGTTLRFTLPAAVEEA